MNLHGLITFIKFSCGSYGKNGMYEDHSGGYEVFVRSLGDIMVTRSGKMPLKVEM